MKSLIRFFSCLTLLALVFNALGVTPARAADINLVGYWALDDGSGATAADSSGYGHPGALTGGSWSASHAPAQAAFTDMGTITGALYYNLPAPVADVLIAGQTVNLYRDTGNGAWDGADTDPFVASDTTDAGGVYRFNALTAGTYFVQQPAEPNGYLTPAPTPRVNTVIITPALAAGTSCVTVDPFGGAAQTLTASRPPTPSVTQSRADASILGGARNVRVTSFAGDGLNVTGSINAGGTNRLLYSEDVNTYGSMIILWNGVAESEASPPTTFGLGGGAGIDLTAGGTCDSFDLNLYRNDLNVDQTITVYTDASHASSMTISAVGHGAATSDLDQRFRFSSFTPSLGAGADFAQIRAVSLIITVGLVDRLGGLDYQSDFLQTVGPGLVQSDLPYDVNPAMNLVKLTNGTDNNAPTGPLVAVGSTVTWTYEVTNPGNVPLHNLSVTDDQGVLPAYQSGDANSDGWLDVGETWFYTATGAAVAGQYTNTGTASGADQWADPISDTDPDYYYACANAITVMTNADSGPGSLRDAIGLACPDGTIDFDGDYIIGLSGGQLVIDKALTIDGTGHSIVLDGQSASRVIYVNAGVTFTLRHVTVMNGSAFDGGGLYNDGATVTLRDMQIGDNYASQYGGGIYNFNGRLDIDPTTIYSNSAGLDGGGLFNEGGTLILTDTLFVSNTASQRGGGLYHWGSPLTVSQTQFVNNSAGLYGGGAYVAWGTALLTQTQFLTNTAAMDGGGLYAVSAGLLLDQSQISGNSADYSGGGVILIAAMGRGAPNRADDLLPNTALIQDTVFQNNTANWGDGGGLNNGNFFSTSVLRSTFTANQALCGGGCGGGGIFNAGQIALDTVTLANNLVDGGEGPGTGGGLQSTLFSTVIMSNSTVSGNTATDLGGGQGGGLAVAGDAHLENSTISGNTAGTGGGLYYAGLPTLNNVTVAGNTGGGVVAEECVECNQPIFIARNTLIADNQLDDGTPQDCVGELNSQGYNLVETIDLCTLSGDLTGVLTGVDPMLGLLQDNGGSTWTMALLAGSPALEAGNPAVPGSGGAACAATDQRGVSRPQGAVCDIGAFEAQGNFIKSVDVIVAQAGQRANYTLVVQAVAPIVNGAISDTLPADVTLAGPITLEPVGGGTLGTLPTLVSDLNLGMDEVVTITVPITVNAGVPNGTVITNVATLTADELPPLNAWATFEVDTFDLSGSIKRVDRSTAMWGDILAYTVTLTNTALHKTSAFTVTDALPAYTNYIAGSASTTVGSTVFMGSPTGGALIWTGALSGTVGAPGYVYGDSLGGGELSGVSYNWIDISTTGTPISFPTSQDDDYFYPITLPFPVTFYGVDYTNLAVATNGTVYFEDALLGFGNGPIPADTGAGVNTFIAAYWDDLEVAPGAVYYEVQGTAPHRRVVIQYDQVSLCCTSAEPGTWEIILYEDRPDVVLQYQDVFFNSTGGDYGGTATVGVQNSVTEGVQYSVDTPALSDGLAIVFAPPPAQNAVAELTFKALVTDPAPNGTWITNTAVVQDDYGDEWSLSAATLLGTPADVSIAKTVTPTVAQPGQAITYTLSVSNVGGLTASGVVLTDEIPISLTGVAYQSAGIAITATGGINQVWQVADLAPGSSGIITITGVISPNIHGVAGFTNTATISALVDGNLADNTSSAWVTLLYNLTIATVGNGTISPTTSSYAYGTVVPITATANVGSSFVGWSGDLSGNTNPTTILIDGHKSITATFALNTYTLTVATVGNGTVSPTTNSYAYGTVAPLTATANVGSTFVGWSGDLSGSTNPTSILIDGDKSITATFALNTYTLTVATVGNGTVSPTTNVYAYGTNVPVTATAGVGSSFAGWSGDLSGSTNPTSILIDGDKAITATFDLNQYTLTVTTVGNGTVAPTTSSYAYGTVVPVTATANVGSAFVGWSGDLSGNTNPTSILIDGDKSITATFSTNAYALTVATVGNGTVSPTTSSYAYGTLVPITATAGVGSSFVGWSGDLSGNTNPTLILIDGDKSITATFALNTYTLTVTTVGNGTVAPTTSSYAYGTVVPVTATANVGSAFVGWSGDLSGSTNPTSILIDGDKSITATFALNTYTLTVATVGNGTVAPTTSAYAYGTVVPVTATANVGSSFVGWSGDLSGNTNPTTILIDGNKFVTATFSTNAYTLTVATVGNGTVTPTTSSYAYGTVVPITATANVGSSFVGWSGDLSGNTNPTTILIDGDKSITATFVLNQYTLTVATVGNGTVAPTTSSYAYGTVVPVTATANVGSSFVGWSGDLSGNTTPTSILIDGDKAITATFALNTYTLTVATVGNGIVAPTTSAYAYGTVVPVTATAGVGSSFIGWSGALSGNTNPTSILINGDKSITATFSTNAYTLTVATVGNGTVAPTTNVYAYGTVVPLTATANVGSSFVGWSGDLSGNTNPTSILIDGDKSITATFSLNTYTLTVATVGNGTVSPTTSSYAYGTSVPLTATANVGSSFVGWSGDLSGSTNPTSILIDGDKSITATFALNAYTLTVATVGDGTVSPTTSAYAYGTVVPITATANVGSAFVSWSGDLSGSTNPTSILIDGNKSITATFALNTYTLTVATVGNGTVAPTTSSYAYGTVVPITATPGLGSSFVSWSGDLSGNTNPTSILIDGSKSITATFDLNQYTLSVATVGNGTVAPTTSSYAYGTVVPITATANVGSAFVGWSGDLSGNTNPTSILIDGDKAITATFALNTYTLTVATVGNGTVAPTTSSYTYGTVVPITATANVGSSFVGWSGDLSGNTNPTSILIDGDKSITATFALNTYTLTVATVGNGSVSPTTSVYAFGTAVPVTATANVGSFFVGWSGDLSGNTNPTTILINGDKSITATFSTNAYTLTVATVGNGTVSPTTSAYAYGTVVPITATAGVGSTFVGWSGDLIGNTNPTSILIDGDKSITATFAAIPGYFSIHLPIVLNNYRPLPDLIVQSVVASSDVITVVIKNIGDGPATEAFWLDAYINPTPPPTAVNEIWWDLDRSHEGVAWGVTEPIAPILPGEVYTLTSNGDFVSPDRTFFPGNLPVGTPIYAQVDAYNAATNYGAVLETHEYYQRPYNNILGPIYSIAGHTWPVSAFQPIGPQFNPTLPVRPVRPVRP